MQIIPEENLDGKGQACGFWDRVDGGVDWVDSGFATHWPFSSVQI